MTMQSRSVRPVLRLLYFGASAAIVFFLFATCVAEAGCVKGFTPSSADEAAIVDVENRWCEAAIHRDAGALAEIFADDISWMEDDGFRDKRGVLDRYLVEVQEHSMELHDVRMRIVGDVAIVQSHIHVRKTVDGKVIQNIHASMDVFIRQKGRWQLLAE